MVFDLAAFRIRNKGDKVYGRSIPRVSNDLSFRVLMSQELTTLVVLDALGDAPDDIGPYTLKYPKSDRKPVRNQSVREIQECP